MELKSILFAIIVGFFPTYQACNPNNPNNGTATTTATPLLESSIELSTSTNLSFGPRTSSSKPTEIANDLIDSYQHIIVQGLPFQRGESHGRQARDKIQKLITFYRQSESMPSWSDCVNLVQEHFLKGLQLYYPNGLEEMKGIAFGANVTLQDIIILNARHELVQWKRMKGKQENGQDETTEIQDAMLQRNECKNSTEENAIDSSRQDSENSTQTKLIGKDQNLYEKEKIVGIGTGAVALSSSTKYAHLLLGQNLKAPQQIYKDDLAILLEVHPDPCEGIKPFVMLAEAGQLGLLGFNADGVGVIGTTLWSSGDGFQSEKAGIPSLLLRRMVLESSSFTTGLEKVLMVPKYASTSLIGTTTSQDDALNMELVSTGDFFIRKVRLEKEFITQSNVFKSHQFMAQSKVVDKYANDISSYFRQMERRLMADWPRITEKTFQDGLSCGHDQKQEANSKMSSIASVVLNLSQRTLLLSKSCNASYKYFKFEFSQL